jgi:hypothetical protein
MRWQWSLPHLDGARGTVARAVILALAAVTLVFIAGSMFYNALDMFRNVPNSLEFGFRTFTAADGKPEIRNVYGAEALAAGIGDHDQIIAVDGKQMPARASEFDIGAALGEVHGDHATLTIRHPDGRVVAPRLPRIPNVWLRPDSFSTLPTLLYCTVIFVTTQSIPLFLLTASFLLFRNRPRDPEALLFALTFLLLSWQEGVLFWLKSIVVLPNSFFQFTGNTAWLFAFLAVAGFPDGRYATLAARLVAVLSLLLIAVMIVIVPFGVHLPKLVGSLLVLSFGLMFAGAGIAVVQRYRRCPAGTPQQQQIKWAAMGFGITACSMVVLLAVFNQGDALSIVQRLPLLILIRQFGLFFAYIGLPLGLLVSLLRYRLYDAEAAISRSVVYGALTVGLLAIFAGSEKVIEILGEEYFGESLGALAGGLGAAVAAAMIVPLHHRVNHWAEHRFQKKLQHLRHGLPLLVGDMRETATIAAIADAVVKRTEAGVRARHAALLVDGDWVDLHHVARPDAEAWARSWTPPHDNSLDCDRNDALFPMRVPLSADGCGRVGWLLLGPRPDGSFYGKDEREALSAIADPVARALAIVRDRQSHERAFEARIDKLEATVALLLGGSKSAAAH